MSMCGVWWFDGWMDWWRDRSISVWINVHLSTHPSRIFIYSSSFQSIYTSIGIALGVKLSHLSTQVHAIGVCDSPDIFYEHIEMIAGELGLDVGGKDSSLGSVRDW